MFYRCVGLEFDAFALGNHFFNHGQEFGLLHRFHQIIFDSFAYQVDSHFRVGEGGNDHDWDTGSLLSEIRDTFQAVHFWHANVT